MEKGWKTCPLCFCSCFNHRHMHSSTQICYVHYRRYNEYLLVEEGLAGARPALPPVGSECLYPQLEQSSSQRAQGGDQLERNSQTEVCSGYMFCNQKDSLSVLNCVLNSQFKGRYTREIEYIYITATKLTEHKIQYHHGDKDRAMINRLSKSNTVSTLIRVELQPIG